MGLGSLRLLDCHTFSPGGPEEESGIFYPNGSPREGIFLPVTRLILYPHSHVIFPSVIPHSFQKVRDELGEFEANIFRFRQSL